MATMLLTAIAVDLYNSLQFNCGSQFPYMGTFPYMGSFVPKRVVWSSYTCLFKKSPLDSTVCLRVLLVSYLPPTWRDWDCPSHLFSITNEYTPDVVCHF